MIIEKLEAFPKSSFTAVKLTTRDGAVGWGECLPATPTAIAAATKTLVGQEASRYEWARTQVHGPMSAAVNMAMLDICGKVAKAPVYQLLGGPTRNKVRALTGWSEKALAAGHRAFVVPGTYTPRDGLDFVVDPERKLSAGQASSLAASLEKSLPLWLDEPCPPANLGAIKKIATESVTPLGWGRGVTNLSEVQNMLREQVIDVVRLDISRHGISTIRKAAALAETYYIAVAPYHAGGPIATAAALHLAASLPNFFIQQVPLADPARAELVGGDIERVKDGFLTLPTKPGLGIEVNEGTLRRMA